MFCSRCGSEITGKSRFCPSCGLDLMATTPVHAIATGAIQEVDLAREALAAEYEVLDELGRGGMALVYRARDRALEREVAIKVLPLSLSFDAEFVERFQREARTAAQLEHPNIIPIYRVGRAGRVIYFAMKLLRGGSLARLLAERQKLTPPEVRRVLLEAGSALGYAAQRGIVHRDIKPDNIMFDEFGQCVLTDFGIAKAASGQRLTGTGMSIGTPHYMSPEQARAGTIDARSDIYSLGVVAYQCLTGSVPYDGEDSFSIGYKHITEPVPTPPLVTADERRLFDVIRRMLMKDPQHRIQSCEELLAALEGQLVSAPGVLRSSRALPATGAVAAISPAALGSAAVGPAAIASAAAGSPAVGTPMGGVVPVGAASAVPAAAGPAGASPAPAGVGVAPHSPPAILSQPTTPLHSPLVDRRLTPRERRELPRRLADRSRAMRRRHNSGLAWFWLVLAVLGGLGGAVYYYAGRGFVPAGRPAAPGDSAAGSGAGGSGVTPAPGGAAVPRPDTLPTMGTNRLRLPRPRRNRPQAPRRRASRPRRRRSRSPRSASRRTAA